MTDDGEPEGTDEALAALYELEADLAKATHGWTDPVIAFTYTLDDDLDEDLADEVSLFDEHGYGRSLVRGEDAVTVTYRRTDAQEDEGPPVIVRAYKAKQQADALARFERDAKDLALDGFYPSAQSWAPGQWGCGSFLVALLLCVVFVGFLVFIYMLIVKPEGTLTVTYARREPEPMPPPVVRSTRRVAKAGRSLAARLAQLDEARDAGLITPEEHATRRGKILDEA